jgi:hypothetical protein
LQILFDKKKHKIFLDKKTYKILLITKTPTFREFTISPWTQGTGFDFWRQRLSKFPLLSPLALAILVVPATSNEARKLLDDLDEKAENERELWKRALLVYNDAYICV